MGEKFALLIGNNEFDDPVLRKLIAPPSDVDSLGTLLTATNLGEFKEVTVLTNETEGVIRRKISRFLTDKNLDDLVLIYFSGHGLLSSRGNLYFAAKDTDHQLLNATAVPASFLNSELDDCISKKQVLILDCCHSGAFARAKGGDKVITQDTFASSVRGRVVLTATDSTQYALDGDQIQGGFALSPFTKCLIQGLITGDADIDKDGLISLDEWYEYTYTLVEETSNFPQKPQKFTYGQQGKIIIAKNPRTNPVVSGFINMLRENDSFWLNFGMLEYCLPIIDQLLEQVVYYENQYSNRSRALLDSIKNIYNAGFVAFIKIVDNQEHILDTSGFMEYPESFFSLEGELLKLLFEQQDQGRLFYEIEHEKEAFTRLIKITYKNFFIQLENESDLYLAIVDIYSNSVLVNEVFAHVLVALYRSVVISINMDITQVRGDLLDALKLAYENVPDKMYKERFEMFRRNLELISPEFQPIISISRGFIDIDRWTFSPQQLAFQNLKRIALRWGDAFLVELDRQIFPFAIHEYANQVRSLYVRPDYIPSLSIKVSPVSILKTAFYNEVRQIYIQDYLKKVCVEIDTTQLDIAGQAQESEKDLINALGNYSKMGLEIAMGNFGLNLKTLNYLTRGWEYISLHPEIFTNRHAGTIVMFLENIFGSNTLYPRRWVATINDNISSLEYFTPLGISHFQGSLIAPSTETIYKNLPESIKGRVSHLFQEGKSI